MSASAPRRAEAEGGHRTWGAGERLRPAWSTHALSAGESAWLAALPCALLLVAAIRLLGPPLGRALFEPPGVYTFWYHTAIGSLPEPTEHAQFLLALLGPLLVSGSVLALAGRRASDAVVRVVSPVCQVGIVAFTVFCVVYQARHVYVSPQFGEPTVVRYFTIPTLAAACLLTLLTALALHHRPTLARIAAATRETTAKRVTALTVAGLATLAWLLCAFNTEGSFDASHQASRDHMPFWSDESFAILNGHQPLVDFHAQYGQLLAYVGAGTMRVFGGSIGVYSATMLAGTAAAMGAVYAALRRVVGRSLLALALFLPFLATSFFLKLGPLDNRYSPVNLFSLFPMRYLGAYLLLWLVVRRLAVGTTALPFALFTAGGLVAINNPEFGVPALGATLAALLWTTRPSSRTLARLLVGVLLGLAAAVALVAALTLVVAGSLPHFGLLTVFPRIYGLEGFGQQPMPAYGLHLVVYLTFAAAIVVATVRAASGAADRALTGALVWSGVFGLGVGGYFAGRSHPQVLTDLFSSWSLALVLLTVVAIRAIAQRPSRRPTLVELLVIAGFGVMACSIVQVPTPWSQIARLREPAPAETDAAKIAGGLRQMAPNEPLLLLTPLAERYAHELGLDDVMPYANIESMVTVNQWREAVEALDRAHGRTIIVPNDRMHEDQAAWLLRAGFAPDIVRRREHLVRYVRFRQGR